MSDELRHALLQVGARGAWLGSGSGLGSGFDAGEGDRFWMSPWCSLLTTYYLLLTTYHLLLTTYHLLLTTDYSPLLDVALVLGVQVDEHFRPVDRRLVAEELQLLRLGVEADGDELCGGHGATTGAVLS